MRSLTDEQRPKGTTQKELAPDAVNYIMPSAQNNTQRVRRVRKKREYSPEELFFVRDRTTQNETRSAARSSLCSLPHERAIRTKKRRQSRRTARKTRIHKNKEPASDSHK